MQHGDHNEVVYTLGIGCGGDCHAIAQNTQLPRSANLTGLEFYHGDGSGVIGISLGSSLGTSRSSSALGFLAQTFRL